MAAITASMVAELRGKTDAPMMECKKALTEASKLGIPVIGVVDTNHSPEGISYVIPGNDDSSRAIRLYARGVADAILEGRSQVIQEIVAAGGDDEFVEVEEGSAE